MDRRGEVFENPVTGERVVVITDPEAHPQGVLVGHLYVRPGGRVAAPHYHPGVEERFLILSGRVGFLIGERKTVLGPGEGATVPAGVVHDWWQAGDEVAEALVEVAPGVRFSEVVGTMFGLARDGKVNPEGLPGPLQLIVMAREYRDTLVFTAPPAPVQRLLFPPLAALGRLLGRRPTYERHRAPSEVVEPSPAALAELTPEGRLRALDGADASLGTERPTI